MTKRILCVIVLIAIGTMSSVIAQDIYPQLIPKLPPTEGPSIGVTNTESIPTTIEDTEEPDLGTQTELIPTSETSSTINSEVTATTTEVTETTTIDSNDTTTIAAAVDTTTEVVKTTTDVSPTTIAATTEKVPSHEGKPGLGGSPPVACRILLKQGTPYYNWFFRAFIIPKTCSFCCSLRCDCKEIEHCIEIASVYCSL